MVLSRQMEVSKVFALSICEVFVIVGVNEHILKQKNKDPDNFWVLKWQVDGKGWMRSKTDLFGFFVCFVADFRGVARSDHNLIYFEHFWKPNKHCKSIK